MKRRSEVSRYVERQYNGEGDEGRRVAGIVTFGTMQAKAAVRDVGRVLGMPFSDVDKLAKLIPNALGITLEQALQDSKELRETVEGDARLGELFGLARALEGQIRNPGRHAAGVVISSRPLLESTPLYRDPRSEEIVTQFDYRTAEKVGLIKFDLLGLRTLTIIQAAVDRIRATRDAGFRIQDIPETDAKTYEVLRRGDTEGIFQVGQSTGMTDLVVRFQPRTFRDVIPLVALYRPGPLQAGMVDDFVERRHGRTRVEYALPVLEEVLSETYGVIVYQDQVMRIANRMASYSMGEADLLRRAMGKKIPAEMNAQRERFLSGCARNGHPREKSEEIFEVMVVFAGYAFPKAHSAAYALITHQTAFLKAHFPAEFYAATMTAEWREPDKLDRYMKDAARRDIAIKAPDVNESDAEFTVAEGGRSVRFGLEGIKNVGEGAVEAIVEARAKEGPFRSLFEFCERVDSHRVNRRVLESLIRCGAFDFTRATRASLAKALPVAMESGQRTQRDRAVGQRSLFGTLAGGADLEPKLEAIPEWPRQELLAGEKETLGFFVTGHPLDDHRRVLQAFASVRIDQLGEEWRNREVRLGGLVTGMATQKTRKGDLMARGQFEDGHGAISVVFFPKCFEQHGPLLRTGEPVFVRGALQIESERCELLAEEVIALDEAWTRYASAVAIRLPIHAATRERLEALRRLLDPVPGRATVAISLVLPSGAEAELRLRGNRVRASEALLREIDGLFGGEVSRCVS
jgi:DNA polymerase III subunit alpha